MNKLTNEELTTMKASLRTSVEDAQAMVTVVEFRYPRGELERRSCKDLAEAESLMELVRKQGGFARIEGSRK